jgi:hypothetical protein
MLPKTETVYYLYCMLRREAQVLNYPEYIKVISNKFKNGR